MKISLEWLAEYIELERSAEQVAETLSNLGLPCEGIEHRGDDTVIDVEVTSNRGDCLGYIGIARELAAAMGKQLKMPVVKFQRWNKRVDELVSVEIAEPDLCCRYTARVIDEVRVGPSPEWLRRRLETVGMRSVNNVVDATNYAMLETGQPPHAFDYAKITHGKIIVRRAIAGERLVSIDGTQCELEPDMLIIADPKQAVAIAGVMGGLATEVGQDTTTVLLEDAYFDPVTVRTTSRRLGLPSEAAFRFERIADIESIDWASQRTAQLICQVAGGKVAKGVVDAYPRPRQPKQVTLRLQRLRAVLGVDVPAERVVRILWALCFELRSHRGAVVCTVPSWRSDVYREVDLIEEVARVYGYDQIPTERKIEIEVAPADDRQKLAETMGTYLNGCGFYETVTVGFVDDSVAKLFSGADSSGQLAVQDVSRRSANLLRRTLLGSLLGVLKTNLNAGNLPCRIFEIADTFVPTNQQDGNLPLEEPKVALACDGDFRDLHGAVEGLVKNIDPDATVAFRPASLVWAEAGAEIVVNEGALGVAGVVGQPVREKFDFEQVAPCAAELEFNALMELHKGARQLKPIPRFPAIKRDLSIVVGENTPWADVVQAVEKEGPDELQEIRFVDVYRGQGIEAGSKSITLSLRFRDEDGTLTHDTVDTFQKAIVQSLAECVGAELRAV